ncbi:porin [Aminobacter sp. UC22_36]|uniref:porin n=1 Tax=Aminobacter sp. UC22_36 TaxID=3374549 RepID=UPI003757E527
MNYRKVMLGCVLAIGAPHGAQSADAAVAAEPEPIGYVRICDTYGAGFYYLPGTETCLRVGGYIRYEIGVGDLFGADRDDDGRGDTYFKRARAALKIDARSETELGTFRRYMHINFQHDIDSDGGHQAMEIESAIIELGGLRIGVNDSLFITFVNYAGYVSKDDVIGYGPFATPQIAYTYKNENGFTAALSLETGYDPFVVDSDMPHVVAGLSYTQSWGGVALVAAYDSVSEEWSGKLRLDATFSDTVSAFAMAGLKSDDSAPYSQFYGIWGGRWAVWGGATIKASDKASVNFQLSYDEDENFAAVANVAYQVVPDLMVTPEIGFYDNFAVDGADMIGGFVRMEASF